MAKKQGLYIEKKEEKANAPDTEKLNQDLPPPVSDGEESLGRAVSDPSLESSSEG